MAADSVIAELRGAVKGEVIAPDDTGYDDARKVWNGAIDRRPAAIVRAAGVEDVQAAVRIAPGHGVEIAVRGGAHSFGGAATLDDGVVIDLGGMRKVAVDPSTRRARVQGGAQWGDLDAASQEHGLAVTGGFISHTGVGGLTLGGGMGWLTRKTGLTIDSLAGADVVTADGRALHASADENAELFWALRGGGGNFGVVTEFDVRLHDVGPLCQLAFFFWPADHGAEALRLARDYIASLPEDFGALIGGLTAPPAPFVPEKFQGAHGWGILIGGFGDPDKHAAAIGALRDGSPAFEFITPIPYVNLQQMFNEGNEPGVLGYEKALFLEQLTDGAIDVLARRLPEKRSPVSFLPIFVVDGASARIPDDATAYGGPRSARYAVNIAGIAPPGETELYEADRVWVRALWEELLPHAVGTGGYVNFMSEYDEDRVRASYGAAKYERLARIKAEYDPDNIFHRMAANIKPLVLA